MEAEELPAFHVPVEIVGLEVENKRVRQHLRQCRGAFPLRLIRKFNIARHDLFHLQFI